MSDKATYEGWSVLELLGHRRLGGYVRAVELAGATFLRIDVPDPGNEGHAVLTQFYSPASVYCLTPVTEAVARAAAASGQPAPVWRWELPAPVKAETFAPEDDEDDEDDPAF